MSSMAEIDPEAAHSRLLVAVIELNRRKNDSSSDLAALWDWEIVGTEVMRRAELMNVGQATASVLGDVLAGRLLGPPPSWNSLRTQ